MWIWCWWMIAYAGPAITLNGVDVSALRDQRFKAVDVWIDAEGNVQLTSDRYQVQPPAAPVPTPDAAPSPGTTPAASTGTPAAGTTEPDASQPAVVEPGPRAGVVPAGTWWLATEDNASRGHEIRVYVNGALVKTLKSGDAQVIEDISRHLKPGENKVMLQTRSLAAGGGGLYVYLGKGKNEGGTVTLSQPDLQHGLGASKQGDDVREFTLRVD